jgi:hypothetical protein
MSSTEPPTQSSPTTENLPPVRVISFDSLASAPLSARGLFDLLDWDLAATVSYSILRDLYLSARSWWFSWVVLTSYGMQKQSN